MKYTSLTVATFLFAAMIVSGPANAETQIPEGWREIDLRFLDHTTPSCVNWSNAEWQVRLEGKKLNISPYNHAATKPLIPTSPDQPPILRGASAYLRDKDGWLVAINRGEWGGSLVWYTDGKPKALHNVNTSALFKQRDFVVAAGGLAHMMSDEGYVARFKKSRRGAWVKDKYYRTGTSILFAFPARKDSIYLVGTQRTSRFDWNRGIQSEHDNYIFQSSYPNSAVIDKDGTIFIGMRHAVSVLKEKNDQWSERWIVRQDCPYLKKIGRSECSCTQHKFGELDAKGD